MPQINPNFLLLLFFYTVVVRTIPWRCFQRVKILIFFLFFFQGAARQRGPHLLLKAGGDKGGRLGGSPRGRRGVRGTPRGSLPKPQPQAEGYPETPAPHRGAPRSQPAGKPGTGSPQRAITCSRRLLPPSRRRAGGSPLPTEGRAEAGAKPR